MTEATTKKRSRHIYTRTIDGRAEEMVTLSSSGESVSVKVGLLQGLVTLDDKRAKKAGAERKMRTNRSRNSSGGGRGIFCRKF